MLYPHTNKYDVTQGNTLRTSYLLVWGYTVIMPLLIAEIIKAVISASIVIYIGILSFFGISNSEEIAFEQEKSSSTLQQEERILHVISLPPLPTSPEEENPTIAEGSEVVEVIIEERQESTGNDTPKQETETSTSTEPPTSPEKSPQDQTVAEGELASATPVPDQEPIQPSFSDINVSTREALVNIFCTIKRAGPLKPITSSGVIIDERGVILTNAHVAQFFLLRDYPTEDTLECIIRTGNPAYPAYRADLLYVSPAWITDNADKIIKENPTGTGENDFAFLLINESTSNTAPLPSQFSFIEAETDDSTIEQDNEILLAGYPAGFLGGISVQRDLYILSTIGKIKELFTFKENTLDLFSVVGSIVSQKGSSGGAVVSRNNKLIGIIVTASEGETTGERELRAITLSHINRSLLAHAGFDLEFLLFGDLLLKMGVFNLTIAPTLAKLLVNELEK